VQAPAKDAAEAQARKVSALGAARVLAEEGRAMSCPELIDAMAAKGYGTSPQGKTPSATLYAALTREIQAKGKEARFEMTGRGQFAFRRAAQPARAVPRSLPRPQDGAFSRGARGQLRAPAATRANGSGPVADSGADGLAD
jgi:hypothetical protein